MEEERAVPPPPFLDKALEGEPRTESQRLRLARADGASIDLAAAGSRQRLVDLTDENFGDEVLNAKVPVVIDFWAQTCGPCRLMHPIMRRLADAFGPRLKVARLNVFENPRTTEALEIKAIPYTMLVHQGNVVLELVGDRSYDELCARIEPFLTA